MLTTIDFIRHGEVTGGSYYRGSTDDPLTPLGWQQMHQAVAKQQWDYIISSPLMRCLNFAQQLNQQTNTPFTSDSNWQEIYFGDWEGKTAEQINSDDLTRFYQDPINNTPKNAESLTLFLARISLAWESLINLHGGKHILVVTHAGVIRCLFSVLLNLPVINSFNLQIDHAGLTRFQSFDQHPERFVKLIFHNLTKEYARNNLSN